MFTHHVSRLVLAAAIATFTHTAFAGDNADIVRMVSTQGLNLTTPSGQAALRHRLDIASLQVCRESLGTDLLSSNATQSCMQDTLSDTSSQVNAVTARAQTPSTVQVASK